MTESPQLMTLLGLGLVLGLKHALDADHVVAVSTVVSQTKSIKKSSLYGALWGIGHTLTLFIVGLVLLTFKLAMPDKIALSFEFLVGIVLVILGLEVLRKTTKKNIHLHKHAHDNLTHAHIHSHKGKGSSFHNHTHRSLIIGMMHGLAGSAALTLLVLTTVTSVLHGLLYILVFGAGSILGMLATSTVIGLPFILTAKFDRLHIVVERLAGTISVGLGVIIMYEIGYVRNLFF